MARAQQRPGRADGGVIVGRVVDVAMELHAPLKRQGEVEALALAQVVGGEVAGEGRRLGTGQMGVGEVVQGTRKARAAKGSTTFESAGMPVVRTPISTR